MLEDARNGLINLILVKDLSRLGRDFVEVGRYTDVVFPSLGCRFVSVLDCLDSEGDNTDMLHFRSLMNDYHLKDLSNKIKSVLHAKKKSDQYLSAFAPYGYRKCEDDKHKLLIDEEAAAIQKSEQLDALLAEADKARQDMEDIQKWASIIKKYLDLQELDRETVDELIDHIEIGERTVIDGQKQQDIKIFYRFVGEV